MNYSLTILEILVVLLGLGLLLADLWIPPERRRRLGHVAACVLGAVLVLSFTKLATAGGEAFGGMYVQDALALFFKRLFLVAAILVLVFAVEFSDRFPTSAVEFHALTIFALAGMMFSASANDFALLFVSVELITVTFYVLTSFERNRLPSLEAGIKYLILGALSSAFLVYGITLVYGTAGTMRFSELSARLAGNPLLGQQPALVAGVLLVVAGLAFKIAAFPLQIWAPDVYQGSPAPATAFLAIGSKAAGFVLLLRVLFGAVPSVADQWPRVFIGIAAITILYGNLCALPQRNLKRLLGYSSISNAGYLLLGIAALSADGQAAVLYYLAGYLFTVLAAFGVIILAMRHAGTEDIAGLAGLNRRSPFLAATLSLAMISLAGIPPLAGFFGKFLLLKAVMEQAPTDPAYYGLVAVALIGVVISLYYYFGVLKVMYGADQSADPTSIHIPTPARLALGVCIAGMLGLGLFANPAVNSSRHAVGSLKPTFNAVASPSSPPVARHP